ncbi:beta-mannosidase [Emticicia sp. ODNR4P]|nr:beta-mannosidase [Emticicia sp. ODNR4P]
MYKRLFFLIGTLTIHFSGISQSAPIDAKATLATRHLYQQLWKLRQKGIMFGQQDALAYGLNADKTRWIGDANRSDVKTVTGDFPAVIGYDLGKIEFDSVSNLDGVPFSKIRQDIQNTHQRGGLNTISWHLNNPTDPNKTSWDKADSTIAKIFSDPKALQTYNSWLDKVANFLASLKDTKGQPIPVLFRPFHEHTGSWFWWGAGFCSPEQYKKVWRYTVSYLKDTKGLHHLLYAYSTDRFESQANYLERYPGDDMVDLIGFDYYHRDAPKSNDEFKKQLSRMVHTLEAIADKKRKLTAITEMGLEQITVDNWWTSIVWETIKDSHLSYMLVWRNGRSDHFYSPYQGHTSAPDFIKFYNLPQTLFSKDVKVLK